MSKKDLHSLFHDKFENYEVTPPDLVWNNIEAKLKEKDDRKRVVPFWWTFSGVAAGFIIAFFCYPFIFETKQALPQGSEVVTKSDSKEAPAAVGSSNTSVPSSNVSVPSAKGSKSNDVVSSSVADVPVAGDNHTAEPVSSKVANAAQSHTSARPSKAVWHAKASGAVASVSKHSNAVKNTTVGSEVASKTNTSSSSKGTSIIASKTSYASNDSKRLNGNAIDAKEGYANSYFKSNAPVKKYSSDFSDKKLRIFSEVTVVQHDKEVSTNKKLDSVATANKVPNPLEELLAAKEKKALAVKKSNKWEVTPNVAPIFFSSLSNGSPLDSKFENNSKSYATNYSYGVGVNYAVNKKFSIRSGLNTFSVDYTTNGITYYQSVVTAAKLQHLNPNEQGATIQIDNTYVSTVPVNKLSVDKQEGSVNQKMGYVEMPVEMSYKLINSKFGLNVIGGFSTLFLNQNAIYLNSNGGSTKIGEADNLNSLHFSTNIGLGLKYGLSPKLRLNMEPVFKYQVNTFNSDSGGFKPYIFGIYSGISYTF